MASTLRVDPSRLVAAASAEADVGAFVAAMAVGQSLAAATASVSQLRTGAALEFAASAFGAVTAAICDELTSHAAKLNTAADTYRRTDEGLGSRLGRVAGTI
ncbi:type VII secretion target [Mycolicibacterium sp. P9-22]|uniref:type VII secretion target n=1 Tax=Mycolicibacterium sp. P9-22 TaxID=2024613 RepID=UPI001883AD59|nr:type VII secretion target [Mycolicibacterium sp. P9-22]